MKLAAFKIQNFRSIINSGWTRLAPDNITALIGQNESGKTSILEAINSFSTDHITEDILRSDLSLPIISCEFLLNKKEKQDFSSIENIPEGIAAQIRKTGSIALNRRWKTMNESVVFYGDNELLAEYEEKERLEMELEEELVEKAEEILHDTSKLVESSGNDDEQREELKTQLSIIQSKIEKLEKLVQRKRNEKKKALANEELRTLQKEESVLKLRFDKIDISYQKTNDKLNKLIIKSDYSEKFLNSQVEYYENEKASKVLKEEISDLQDKLEFGNNEKEGHLLEEKMKELVDNLGIVKKNQKELNSNYFFARECLALVVSGSENDIESRAYDKLESINVELSLNQLGEEFIIDLPEFNLFEDFSSLLPNRIDLEDILNMNMNVEGYNAAKNFLIVSGLEAKFFRESSNRILKQKIENLNSDITVNFQGYWRQYLGKNNKIRLNFELEHYDNNHPDKKGKPYLEFWIKDEFERLYPKQRSRGVRWFLSFYLELKATSLSNNKKGKVLLIDEPGLSLHARAQEDVLKVFEDLKENIQIIYSTHSPHLVNTDKIYRLLAVQRADENDDRSETMVFDAQSFSKVSGDTLSPIYTLLGSQISESNFIKERNNIIVEDTTAFYYLKTLFEIFSDDEKAFFLPATGISSVPLLVNLMTGWKLKFGVLLTDRDDSKKVVREIRENLFRKDNVEFSDNIKISKSYTGFENLFSTIDFKKFILRKRVGITEENLEYLTSNDLNRTQLATAFALHCQNNPVKPDDFDEESQENIKILIEQVREMLD